MKKNNHNIPHFFIGAILLLSSCIETYTPRLDIYDSSSLLVVEGQITNKTGPFKVRLTESVSLYNDQNLLYNDVPVSGADVQIFDDHGNAFRLFENENGWYETEDKHLKGTTGYSYTLSITTPDGQQYESTPVLMQEVPDIDKIRFEEYTTTRFEDLEPIEERRFNILVDSKPSAEENIHMRWEFEETWIFEIPTKVLVNHGMGEGAPPPTIESIEAEKEKVRCWITEPSRDILVESSVKYSAEGIRGFVLQSIGPDSDRLNSRYSILVKQYSINKELYTFFNKLREVNTETEGIFSKNPGQVFGNIVNCNTGENALGYFSASEVKTKRIFIDPSEHDVDNGNFYENCGWTDSPPRDPRTGEFLQPTYVYGTYKGDNGNDIVVYSTGRLCVDCSDRGYNTKPDFWE
jgi:hypothetical protein